MLIVLEFKLGRWVESWCL